GDERLAKSRRLGVCWGGEELPAGHEKQEDCRRRPYSPPASCPSPRRKECQNVSAHFIDAFQRSVSGGSEAFVKPPQSFHLPLTGGAHFQVLGHSESVVGAEFVIHERAQQLANVFTLHGQGSFPGWQ